MPKPRPATLGQTYRLNRLLALKLVPVGEGDEISAETADAVLAKSAKSGTWKPKRVRKETRA